MRGAAPHGTVVDYTTIVIPSAYSPAPPTPPPPARGDRLLTVAAVIVAIALIAAIYGPRFGARPADVTPFAYRVDLNTADRGELMQVPGIGPSRADAIIAQRNQTGPFRTADDLAIVKGIGTKTVDGIRSFVLTDETAPTPKSPTPSPATTSKLKPGDAPLDINRCSEIDLQRLPAVGPVLAGRIVAARPFATIDDLRRVKGIGVKIFDGLKPFVKVDP
jgi:competence protein ComEA